MTSRWEAEDIEKKLRENEALAKVNPAFKITPESKSEGGGTQGGNKYHVAPKEDRIYNGILYASKKEAKFAGDQDLRIKAGEISFWLRQVPFLLPGGTIYRLDFMTFGMRRTTFGMRRTHDSWYIEFIEVKGYRTALGELKRKQCSALYKIHIDVV